MLNLQTWKTKQSKSTPWTTPPCTAQIPIHANALKRDPLGPDSLGSLETSAKCTALLTRHPTPPHPTLHRQAQNSCRLSKLTQKLCRISRMCTQTYPNSPCPTFSKTSCRESSKNWRFFFTFTCTAEKTASRMLKRLETDGSDGKEAKQNTSKKTLPTKTQQNSNSRNFNVHHEEQKTKNVA